MNNSAEQHPWGDRGTRLAIAERADPTALARALEKILREQYLMPLIEAMPVAVLVINEERQLLAANGRACEIVVAAVPKASST